MKVRIDPETGDLGRGDKNTRAKRAAEHAYTRRKARHVERDYFGRPLEDIAPPKPVAQVMAKKPAGPRLDAWLVTQGLAPSRDKAKALICAGLVSINGSYKVKPATPVEPDDRVEVQPAPDEPSARDDAM